ncbi:MAG: DUF3201 domain-containing protein [Oscillospiraceae bacterium]|nr:DUF3201 domain-containing protein [Oscillospiraceae bacterium]
MNMEVLNYLNEIYAPICAKYDEIRKALKKSGIQIKSGFFNNHSVKHNGVFVTETFPIPVISLNGIGDIGIDIDCVWLEIKLSKEKALRMDYHQIASEYRFEIYGEEDYLCDIYNDEMRVSDITANIENSQETTLCICFYFNNEVNIDELLKVVDTLSSQ